MKKRIPKIPHNAKRVFEGVIFDVYQWPQKMFDGTTEIFEVLKRPDTVQIITTTTDKKILILSEEQPTKHRYYSLPGGRHDQDETLISAARRELKEETGYTTSDWTFWYKESPTSKLAWEVYTYIARNATRIAKQKLDSGEKILVKKFTFDQFINLANNSSFRDPSLKTILTRALYNSKERAKLKKLLFG